jgi:CHAD domain-containing protein
VAKPSQVTRLDARTPLSEAAPRLLHARLADLRHAEAAVSKRLTPDSVHDLRVACRRLRAAVTVFGKERLRRLETLVERLQDALGAVRDLQLQIRWLEKNGGGAAPQKAALRLALAHLERELEIWMRKSAPRLLLALPETHGKGRLGGSRSRKKLRKRARKLETALRQASDLAPGPAHALRIAARKLRYEAELLTDAFHAEEWIEALARLQGALGDVHDADVRLQIVRKDARLTALVQRERKRLARAARASLRKTSPLADAIRAELEKKGR